MYLTQLLHRNVQQMPDGVATINGSRTATWSQSVDRVARLSAGLRHLGVGTGDRVGVLAHNCDRYHEGVFATWWRGAAINPINTRWSAQEIAFSIEDCGTRVMFVDDTFSALVPEIRALAPTLQHVVLIGDGELPDRAIGFDQLLTHAAEKDERIGGEALAGIFYTGGSTGHPKGVMLSHTNMLCSGIGSLATGQYVVPGGRMLHTAPMFHLAGLAAWLMRNLDGGTNIFAPTFTPDSVIEAIHTHRITEVSLVPTMLQMLLDSPRFANSDLTSLQRVMYGASPISEALLDRLAHSLPNVKLTQSYGMTELGPIATTLPHQAHADSTLRRSAGRATPHSEVRIIDPEGHDLPCGEVGEVTVRGGHVMLGYWNRPAETAAAIKDGWMHTGDAAYLDKDGYLYIVDRIKDMIITGGENVYSAEVENAIAAHPAVASCAVVGLPDDKWGEQVHAVLVLRPGQDLSLQDLRHHVKALIAGYKAPQGLTVVEQLPLSGAGKVDKRALRTMLLTPPAKV